METLAIPVARRALRIASAVRRTFVLTSALGACLAAVVVVAAAVWEMQTFALQARQLASVATDADYRIGEGPSEAIRFPSAGPYDLRLGYARIPAFLERLRHSGFEVERQARFSPRLLRLTAWGISPLYREKTQAGLTIAGSDGRLLYEAAHPERVFESFEAIPRVVVDSLLFVENRELLDPHHPRRNPAVEWDRLARSAFGLLLDRIDRSGAVPGGSTLATQIEKFRHSPGGLTDSPREKLRQMLTASLRAYRDGDDTTETRRQIVVDYMNSVSLAAVPGYGEVIGIPQGLAVWYGEDFRVLSAMLHWPAEGSIDAGPEARARAFKMMLSLVLAARRPTEYLVRNPRVLAERTDTYIEILRANGVIPEELARHARRIELDLGRPRTPDQDPSQRLAREVVGPVRARLAGILGTANYYELDRLDLSVDSTLDSTGQRAIVGALRSLGDPESAAALGLMGPRLLGDGDPARVVYSFSLYESLGDRNVLRIQADNREGASSVNELIRLDLGSTAKLRTLATYLDVMAALHLRYAGRSSAELRAQLHTVEDPLSRWAIVTLSFDPNMSLSAFLEGAMARRYSASPDERFFTGGGLHRFRNFDDGSDGRVYSVERAFEQSINLVFIRLMRDIASYFMYGPTSEGTAILADRHHPRRREYLERFADYEGRIFIERFVDRHRGRSLLEMVRAMLGARVPTPETTALLVRAIAPEADLASFASAVNTVLAADEEGPLFARAHLDLERATELFASYDPERFTLGDLGYLARVHPLELWVAGYLHRDADASLAEILDASKQARLDAYDWLFRTRNKRAQDLRIRQMLEREAFDRVLANWRRYGYPFETITPSYATAIGASGDRPAALAELAGIILNNGRRLPTQRIERLRLGEGTPYETVLAPRVDEGEQVMHPAVAALLRRAMTGVVERGTARRVADAFARSGYAHVIGGKTGTGDHVYRVFDANGEELSSRAVSRAGTFVYFIDDRWFGVVTAYVTGRDSRDYAFTSALPVQLLRSLAPVLEPVLVRSVRPMPLETAEIERVKPEAAPAAAAVRLTDSGQG